MEPEVIEAYAKMLEGLAGRIRSGEVNVLNISQERKFQEVLNEHGVDFQPTGEFSLSVKYWVKS